MLVLDTLTTEQLEVGDIVSFIGDDGVPDTIAITSLVDEIDSVRVFGYSLDTGDKVDTDFFFDQSFDYYGKAEAK